MKTEVIPDLEALEIKKKMSETFSNEINNNNIEAVISIKRATILSILEDIKDSVSRKNTTIPATQNILVKTNIVEGSITWIATNMRVSIKKITRNDFEITGETSFTIEPSLLYQTIKSIKTEGGVLFEISKSLVFLKIGRNKFQFPKGEPESFIEFPEMNDENVNSINIPLLRLKEIMKSASACLGEEAIENAFSGIRFGLKDDNLLFTSTDRVKMYHLLEQTSPFDEKNHETEIIFPRHFVDFVMKLRGISDVFLEYGNDRNSNHIKFKFGENIAMIRKISGKYPSTDGLIKNHLHNNSIPVNINKGALKDVLSVVLKYSEYGEAKFILNKNEKTFEIQAQTIYENATTMYLPFDGEPFNEEDITITLNVKKILDIILSSEAKNFRFRIPIEPGKPVVIIPQYDEEEDIETIDEEYFFLMPIYNVNQI